MVRLSETAQQDALHKVGILCALRHQGTHTEEQIAQTLGFSPKLGLPAAQTMYTQLEAWGLPEWLVYPRKLEYSGEPNQTEGTKTLEAKGECTKKPEGKSERQVRSTGDMVDIPPARRAAELFRWQIKRRSGIPPAGVNVLLVTLEEHVDELDELAERLHGQQFLSAFRIENDWESYDRTMFSEGEWKELCEEHGVDPTREEFVLSLEPYVEPVGAKVTPSPGLTQLIAVYALRNRSLDPLLDALHGDPSEVDRAGLKKDIEELHHYAGRIARRVRGGTVSPRGGRPAPEVPRYELAAKWSYIDPLREKGYSDEEIMDELNRRRYKKEDGKAFSLDDVRRLAGLKLPPPF